mgnify:CR=1 FL=1
MTFCSRRRAAIAVLFLAALVVPGTAVAQSIQTEREGRVGDAHVVGAASMSAVSGGGSDEDFSIVLPEGASCPGDSISGDWRISSFMVPAADDPASFTYSSTKPEGDGRLPLYQLDTRSFVAGFTAQSEEPGGPGPIVDLPSFTFRLFPPGRIEPGAYRIGLACTLYNETYRYWDTEIELVADPSDQPAQLRWSVVGAPQSPRDGVGPWVAVAVAGAVGALAFGVLVSGRRRSRRRPDPSITTKEMTQ